jgi:hypothetical protein
MHTVLMLILMLPSHAVTACRELVVRVVYELSNIMKIVGDDLKIHQTFLACLTLNNTLDETVS